MVISIINRFDVWRIRLNSTEGSEQRGVSRPYVIISPQELIDHLSVVTIAPLTSQSRKMPFRVACQFQNRNALILLEQVRTISKDRLLNRMGSIDEQTAMQVVDTLQAFFAY